MQLSRVFLTFPLGIKLHIMENYAFSYAEGFTLTRFRRTYLMHFRSVRDVFIDV